MAHRLVPGTRLGRYELLCPLGSGGMASVWTARASGSRGFERIFAIKVLLPFLAADPEMQQLFTQEAEIAAAIRHPNVCPVFDLGEADGHLFMVMEWVDGETVGALLAGGFGPVRPEVAARIVSDASAGLAAAFGARTASGGYLAVLHRDISPNNILVSTDGVVKLSDFGIAKILSQRKSSEFSVVRGKPSYMSPERASGRAHDHRSDVYSLGCVLFELLTGETIQDYVTEHAIESGTRKLLRAQDATAVSPLSGPASRNAGVDGELVQILVRATSSRLENRFSSAEQLRSELEGWLAARGMTTASQKMVVETVKSRAGSRIAAKRAALHDAMAALGPPRDEPPSAVPAVLVPTIPPSAPRGATQNVALPLTVDAPKGGARAITIGFAGGFLAVAMAAAFVIAFTTRTAALHATKDGAGVAAAEPSSSFVAPHPVVSAAPAPSATAPAAVSVHVATAAPSSSVTPALSAPTPSAPTASSMTARSSAAKRDAGKGAVDPFEAPPMPSVPVSPY